MGVNQLFGGVARVLGPVWGAAVYDAFSTGMPFLTASAGVGLAFVLALGLRRPAVAVTAVPEAPPPPPPPPPGSEIRMGG